MSYYQTKYNKGDSMPTQLERCDNCDYILSDEDIATGHCSNCYNGLDDYHNYCEDVMLGTGEDPEELSFGDKEMVDHTEWDEDEDGFLRNEQ